MKKSRFQKDKAIIQSKHNKVFLKKTVLYQSYLILNIFYGKIKYEYDTLN